MRTLAMLVELFERGMREPLPLYCKTSAAYAAAVAAGKDGRAAAEKEWTSGWNYPKEDASRSTASCSAGRGRWPSCSRSGRATTSRATAGTLDEPSRAGRYARRLWDGLLAREELIDR